MDKFLGVLQSDAEAGAEASRSGKQSKLEQMLQAQMLADIMRANNNLKALKNFRVNNDKMYRDKAAENAHRKEIREPLDNALNEIDLLNSKVERRDEMILVLRRQLYTELLRNMQGSGNSKSSSSSNDTIHDLQAAEEMKVLTLSDQSDRYKQMILAQQQQITKIKRSLAFQVARVKELYTEIEAMEFAHADHIRKTEADKEIYMGMVDSRDTKIEKLMEDKDELTEQLQAAEETITSLQHKGELKKAQQRSADLESRLKEAETVMSIQRERFAALDVEHQQLSEENAVMKDKQEDLQSRYDSLIVELDQMVEEGYYIPTTENTPQQGAGPSQRSQNISKSLVNDQSQLQSSSQANPNIKRKSSKGLSRAASIKKQRSTQANTQNTQNSVSNEKNKQRSISITNGIQNSNTINELENDDDNHNNGSVSSLDSVLEEKDNALLTANTINNSATSATSQMIEDEPKAQKKQVGRFALRRQEEDLILAERLQANAALRQKDTLLTQISSLQQEVLKQKTLRAEETKKSSLAQDGLQLGQRILTGELNRMSSKLQDMESVNSNLRDEVQVLKTTNSMLQNQVSSTQNDDSEYLGPGKLNRKKSSIYQRLSQMVIPRADPADLIAEAAIRAELRLEAQEEEAIRLEREKLAQEKLQLQQQHALQLQLEEERKQRRQQEQEQQAAEESGAQVDMLQYMYAWENVYENSKDTQALVITDTIAMQVEETELEPLVLPLLDDSQVIAEQVVDSNASQAMTEDGTHAHNDGEHSHDGERDGEYDYDSEYDDDHHHDSHHHDSHQQQKKRKGSRRSRREHRQSSSSSSSTNNKNSGHLTPSQLFLINKPFEELFQGLSLTISSFLPPHKLQLLYPESHASNLSIEEVIAGLDIEWQVKHGLALLAAVNELRNAFVKSHLPAATTTTAATVHDGHEHRSHHHHHGHAHHEEAEQQAGASPPQSWYDQLPPGVAPSVRCLDLILQSLHHLLSPLLHLQRSNHPELLHLFMPEGNKAVMDSKMNVIRNKMFPPDLESRKPFQAFNSTSAKSQQHSSEERKGDEVKQDEEDVYLALSSAMEAIPPPNTLAFPLTEPRLSADYVRGAPRGALSPDHNFTHSHRSHKMNSHSNSSMMSMLPRKLPRHVDQLLDLIEKESRMKTSRSPSPSASFRPNTAVDGAIMTAKSVAVGAESVAKSKHHQTEQQHQEHDQQQLFGGLFLASEGIIEEYRHSLTLDPPPHSDNQMMLSDSIHDPSLASSSFALSNHQYRSSSPKQPPSIDSSVVRHLLSLEDQEEERERDRQKRAAVSFTIDHHLMANNAANKATNNPQGQPQSAKGLRRGSPAHAEQSTRPRFLWPSQANNDSSVEFVDYKRLAFNPQAVPSLAHPRSAHGSRPVTVTSSYQPPDSANNNAYTRPRTSNNNNANNKTSSSINQQQPPSRGRPSSTSASIQPGHRSEKTHHGLHPPAQHNTQANEAEELLLQATIVSPRGLSAPQVSRQQSQSPPSRLQAANKQPHPPVGVESQQKHFEQQQQEQSLAQLYSTSLALSSSIKYGRHENESGGMDHQLSIASQPMQPLPRPTSSAAAAINIARQQQQAVMTVTINPATTAISDEPLSPNQQQNVPAPLPPQPETSAARELLVRYLAHTQRDFNKQYGNNDAPVVEKQHRREKPQQPQQQSSPRQPSRPSNMANPPVTKFYSPRVARHLLLPGTGKETPLDFTSNMATAATAAAVDLRDTAVMLNALDDHRIFPSLDHTITNPLPSSSNNQRNREVMIVPGGDRPGSGLVILGNKSRPAASREKVTGSFLFM